jgi:hypothetical protein
MCFFFYCASMFLQHLPCVHVYFSYILLWLKIYSYINISLLFKIMILRFRHCKVTENSQWFLLSRILVFLKLINCIFKLGAIVWMHFQSFCALNKIVYHLKVDSSVRDPKMSLTRGRLSFNHVICWKAIQRLRWSRYDMLL